MSYIPSKAMHHARAHPQTDQDKVVPAPAGRLDRLAGAVHAVSPGQWTGAAIGAGLALGLFTLQRRLA